jgi:hypothetical protein
VTAHDRWLANYRSFECDVFCHERDCPHAGEAQPVTYISEYGCGWYEPEECQCGGEWHEDPLPDDEEDDDDQ